MRVTIRTKIFAGMVAVAVAFIALSLFIAHRFMGSIAADEVTYTLRGGELAYQRFTALRDNYVAMQARSIAQTPHLRAVMNISDVDHETVLYTARTLYEVIDMDLMLLVDVQGKLLADAGAPLLSGRDLRPFPGVEAGLGGTEYSGIWAYQDSLYRIALTPVVVGDQLLGLLVLGDLLDAAAATEIREFTGKDVLIVRAGEIIAQSRENPEPGRVTRDEVVLLAPLLERTGVSEGSVAAPFRTVLGGRECFVVGIPLGRAGGYAVLFRSLDELESRVDGLRISILGVGGGSMVLAVMLSLWLSARVSRPIRELRDAAEQFGAGKLEKRVRVHSADELGQLTQSFNLMVDNLEAAYQELTRSEQRYRTLVETPDLIVMLRDAEGRYLYVSPQIETWTGATPQEFYEDPQMERRIIHPDDFEAAERAFHRAGGDASMQRVEFRWRGDEKEYRWASETIFPVCDRTGRLDTLQVVVQDITSRRRAEEMLREFSRHIVQLQEEERRRVARELHDGVNQVLTAVSFGIEAIEEKIHRRDRDALAQIEKTRQLLDEVIQEIRRISYNLRPSVLDDLGLLAAVRSLCDEFSTRTQTRVDLAYSRFPEHLPRELETTLYRILQEALNNIEKHAEATGVKLHFASEDSYIRVSIQDDGRGFDAPRKERESRGSGLNNMKERAALVDGALKIESLRDSGTEIVVRLPLSAGEERRDGKGTEDKAVAGG